MAARLGLPLHTVVLPRRSDRRRSHRPLSAQGRRDGLDRRPADPRGARRRHLLSRRGGGGAQGRHRGAASADRRPPHPAARAHRRDAARARRLHAGDLLQSRLPEHPEVAEAVDAAALRRHRIRLSAARAGGRDRRARKRARRATRCRPPCGAGAGKLRALKGQDLEEGVSTRLLVYCASLIAAGMKSDERDRAA